MNLDEMVVFLPVEIVRLNWWEDEVDYSVQPPKLSSCSSVRICNICRRWFLFLFRDAASRRALQLALQQLAESQPEATAKNLLQSLQSSGISGKAGVPRWGGAEWYSFCFVWSLILKCWHQSFVLQMDSNNLLLGRLLNLTLPGTVRESYSYCILIYHSHHLP